MDLPLVANVFSILALVFVSVSYFVKNKMLYLLFQFLCIIGLISSYFFTLEFVAMIGLTIGLFRTLTFFLYEKNDKNAPIIWSFIYSILTIASFLLVNKINNEKLNPIDLLCIIPLCLYAFIFRIRNIKLVRFLMIVPTCLSIIYNLLTVPLNALSYIFELCATITAIFTFYVFRKNIRAIPKEKKNEEN